MASPQKVVLFFFDSSTGAPKTGLTPTFDTYKDDTGANLSQPAIVEIGGGAYDFTPVFADPNRSIVYCVNPGAGALPSRLAGNTRPEDFQKYTLLQFTGGGDLVNPYVLKVLATTRNQILITFSKSVRMDTSGFGALNVLNYKIAGLSIIAVTQKSDAQVQVTTTTQVPGLQYDLQVIDVTDLSGNPIITP